MFSEKDVDIVIDYVLDLSAAEMKTFKLLVANGVTHYKALEQVIDKREQKIDIYLRKGANAWKNEILSKSRNVCFITEISRPDRMEVHHVNISFDTIIANVFKNTGIRYRPYVKEYNPAELRQLLDNVTEVHKGVQGVVLLQEVHQLFHKEYGVNNNTLDQIYALKTRFTRGEFKINM